MTMDDNSGEYRVFCFMIVMFFISFIPHDLKLQMRTQTVFKFKISNHKKWKEDRWRIMKVFEGWRAKVVIFSAFLMPGRKMTWSEIWTMFTTAKYQCSDLLEVCEKFIIAYMLYVMTISFPVIGLYDEIIIFFKPYYLTAIVWSIKMLKYLLWLSTILIMYIFP